MKKIFTKLMRLTLVFAVPCLTFSFPTYSQTTRDLIREIKKEARGNLPATEIGNEIEKKMDDAFSGKDPSPPQMTSDSEYDEAEKKAQEIMNRQNIYGQILPTLLEAEDIPTLDWLIKTAMGDLEQKEMVQAIKDKQKINQISYERKRVYEKEPGRGIDAETIKENDPFPHYVLSNHGKELLIQEKLLQTENPSYRVPVLQDFHKDQKRLENIK